MSQSGRAHDLKQTPLDDMPADMRLLDRLLAHLIDAGRGAWCACADCDRILDDLAMRYDSVEVGVDLVFLPRDDPHGLCFVLRVVPGDARP